MPRRPPTQTGKVKAMLARLSLPSAPSWPGIDTGTEALAHAYDLPKP
jgi:hypothetical protein